MKESTVANRNNHLISEASIKQIVKEAALKTDRNWWFIFSFAMLIFALLLLVDNMRLRNELTYKYDVAFVKMYHNGSWEIEFNDSDRAKEMLPATVDSILTEWVVKRYSEYRHSIEHDYGQVNMLMSAELSADFVSIEGFNAPQKAADIVACRTCPSIQYKVGPIDHFSSNPSQFGTEEGTLYQTQVFVTRSVVTTPNSKTQPEESKRIVRIKWRLMTQREIKQRVNQDGGKEWLRYDPIGLEIVGYEELEETN